MDAGGFALEASETDALDAAAGAGFAAGDDGAAVVDVSDFAGVEDGVEGDLENIARGL